jgi:hypothetical protein
MMRKLLLPRLHVGVTLVKVQVLLRSMVMVMVMVMHLEEVQAPTHQRVGMFQEVMRGQDQVMDRQKEKQPAMLIDNEKQPAMLIDNEKQGRTGRVRLILKLRKRQMRKLGELPSNSRSTNFSRFVKMEINTRNQRLHRGCQEQCPSMGSRGKKSPKGARSPFRLYSNEILYLGHFPLLQAWLLVQEQKRLLNSNHLCLP